MGVFRLTQCPWNFVDHRTVQLMRYVRLAERHLPVDGGLLDQASSFVEAMDWIEIERGRWKSELGIR